MDGESVFVNIKQDKKIEDLTLYNNKESNNELQGEKLFVNVDDEHTLNNEELYKNKDSDNILKTPETLYSNRNIKK